MQLWFLKERVSGSGSRSSSAQLVRQRWRIRQALGSQAARNQGLWEGWVMLFCGFPLSWTRSSRLLRESCQNFTGNSEDVRQNIESEHPLKRGWTTTQPKRRWITIQPKGAKKEMAASSQKAMIAPSKEHRRGWTATQPSHTGEEVRHSSILKIKDERFFEWLSYLIIDGLYSKKLPLFMKETSIFNIRSRRYKIRNMLDLRQVSFSARPGRAARRCVSLAGLV